MNFSLAIADDLASELCNFKKEQQCDIKIVEKILHYYKDYPIFTKNYLVKYYTDQATLRNMAQSISSVDFNSIETISKSTTYKVILTNDETKKTQFPYIYIFDDILENNFTATFHTKDPRDKAIEHLKALLENANCVFVYDLYIANNWRSFLYFVRQCFPKKQLTISYPQEIDKNNLKNPNITKLTQQQCTEILQVGGKMSSKNLWSFKPDNNHPNFTNLHDRYLIIDNKIEVIFTSGIDYLIDKNKDFTYIVRPYNTRVKA